MTNYSYLIYTAIIQNVYYIFNISLFYINDQPCFTLQLINNFMILKFL